MDGERKGKLVDCHDDFERILVTGDTEELNELKGWLFTENGTTRWQKCFSRE